MRCVARVRNLYYLFRRTDTLVLSVEKSNKSYNSVTWALGIHSGAAYLRACLHGVGDPGLMGLVSFVFTLWGTQNKGNLPH